MIKYFRLNPALQAERYSDLTPGDVLCLGLAGQWLGDGSLPDGTMGGSANMQSGWSDKVAKARQYIADWDAQRRAYSNDELNELISYYKGWKNDKGIDERETGHRGTAGSTGTDAGRGAGS